MLLYQQSLKKMPFIFSDIQEDSKGSKIEFFLKLWLSQVNILWIQTVIFCNCND